MGRPVHSCLFFTALLMGLVNPHLAAKAQEGGSTEPKFATAVVPAKARAVPAYSSIAISDVHLSDNTVAAVGFPLGELAFVIQPGESVDLVDIFPNDGESVYTFKVRNGEKKSGYVLRSYVDVREWVGDRGALLRILTERPYESDGDFSTGCSGAAESIKKLEEFIDKYPSSRFIDYAGLAILSTKCSSMPDVLQEVWNELRGLKENKVLGERKMRVKEWSPEVSRLYSTLAKREDQRLQELFELCSLVGEMKRSVPSPVSSLKKR